MGCLEIYLNQNNICKTFSKKYMQEVQIINKKDVEIFAIDLPTININNNFECYYRIAFKLKEGKKALRFINVEKSNLVNARFSRALKEDIPQYTHLVDLPIYGTTEEVRCLLNSFEFSDYYAMVKTLDGTIECYGFEFGLLPNNYTYSITQGGGGSVITLSSEEAEDFMPFIYYNQNGQEQQDWENSFEDVNFTEIGEFNDDFNDDFNIST